MSEMDQIRKIVNDLVFYNNKKKDAEFINPNNIYIGNIVKKNGVCGCVNGIDGWYFYSVCDRDDVNFVGPFNSLGVIKAISTYLRIGNEFEYLKFTSAEQDIYIYNTMTDDEFFENKKKAK